MGAVCLAGGYFSPREAKADQFHCEICSVTSLYQVPLSKKNKLSGSRKLTAAYGIGADMEIC
jgi:hypothetical protein